MNYPYRVRPIHVFPWLRLERGYAALATQIGMALDQSPRTKVVVIDGFSCVRWSILIEGLTAHLDKSGHSVTALSTEACLRSPADLDSYLSPFLTDDPVFGRLFHGQLTELWDAERVASFKDQVADATRRASGDNRVVIVYGPGAARLVDSCLTIYVDVPKDAGQAVAARGEVLPLGAAARQPFNLTYKRLYFVEWPILNREKRRLLATLDLFVDLTDIAAPVIARGDQLRQALDAMSTAPIRVKPWFAPGPWGGQWMKENFGLPPNEPNYAWSFELIAPENGVLLASAADDQAAPVLECSFDALLWRQTAAVLGERVAARYGSYFPIRFDYLDTMGGTNLSCQVHPRLDYIRDEFGEPFTQDETYYIVTCQPGAQVFLGLRDNADILRFQAAARAARDQAIPFEITDHVASLPSAPHNLFLIPSGTVHCSGANNLVLEISATPYIYTFKIYDYLRTDLRGNLRHVHLDHAFANLDATRTAGWVQQHLVPQPAVLREGPTWAEYSIGDIESLFFCIHRLEFCDEITDETRGTFLALNLVEGERCDIIAPGHEPIELRFAESIVIPASVPSFQLRNTGQHPCKVVKAFVKG